MLPKTVPKATPLTGARKGEVLRAEWSQIDFERGVWTKPSSHTKYSRSHGLRSEIRFSVSFIADSRGSTESQHGTTEEPPSFNF